MTKFCGMDSVLRLCWAYRVHKASAQAIFDAYSRSDALLADIFSQLPPLLYPEEDEYFTAVTWADFREASPEQIVTAVKRAPMWNRYSWLSSHPFRDDDEEREVHELAERLWPGAEPGLPIEPRETQ